MQKTDLLQSYENQLPTDGKYIVFAREWMGRSRGKEWIEVACFFVSSELPTLTVKRMYSDGSIKHFPIRHGMELASQFAGLMDTAKQINFWNLKDCEDRLSSAHYDVWIGIKRSLEEVAHWVGVRAMISENNELNDFRESIIRLIPEMHVNYDDDDYV